MRRLGYLWDRFCIFTHTDEFELGMFVFALAGLLVWWRL